MGKHESPPLRMLIERGKLVPATPYDAERLDTYRPGMRVNVRLTEERDRVLVRKWFAIIGLVVKQCPTPWKTKDQASEAIKLALGIVNLSKTVGGEFMSYPKSLTELEDPELQEAVDDMITLLQRITGVDPETLRKEAAHVGEDEQEPSDPDADPEPTDAGDDTVNPLLPENGVVAELSADEAVKQDGAGEASPSDPAPSSTNSADRLDCITKMLAAAQDKDLPSKQEKIDAIAEAADWWLAKLDDNSFVTTVFQTAKKVIKGELQAGAAKLYLEGIV